MTTPTPQGAEPLSAGVVRIERWAVVVGPVDRYDPPECIVQHLHGVVYGHPRKSDGTLITTSKIVSIDGQTVRTHSGTVYRLGDPDPDYVLWCRVNRLHVPTPDEPIRVHGPKAPVPAGEPKPAADHGGSSTPKTETAS